MFGIESWKQEWKVRYNYKRSSFSKIKENFTSDGSWVTPLEAVVSTENSGDDFKTSGFLSQPIVAFLIPFYDFHQPL
jgi:hypothetical protein